MLMEYKGGQERGSNVLPAFVFEPRISEQAYPRVEPRRHIRPRKRIQFLCHNHVMSLAVPSHGLVQRKTRASHGTRAVFYLAILSSSSIASPRPPLLSHHLVL